MGWDENDLKAWNISTLAVTYLIAIVAAEIIVWGFHKDNIFEFFLFFNVLLLGITVVFLVRVYRLCILGRSEFLEKSPLLGNIWSLPQSKIFRQWLVWIGCFLILVCVVIGISFAGLGCLDINDKLAADDSSPFERGGLLATLGITLIIQAFAVYQAYKTGKEHKELHNEFLNLK